MTAPRLGQGVPPDDSWVARKFADLQRQITELRSAKTLNSATIDAGGLQIIDGGSLQVVDPATGNVVLYMGSEAIPDGSGRTQMSFWLRRDDGTYAFEVRDGGTVPGHTHQQSLAIRDRLSGRIVLSDDTVSGHGLATPHVPGFGLANTNTSTWPSTTAATWTSIADAFYEVQNPRLQWSITLQADAATTGQFRLLVGGTQVDVTQTVTAGFATWQPASLAMPAGVNVGDIVDIELDAQRTSGTGTVRAQVKWLSGMQS